MLYHVVCELWQIDDSASVSEKIRFYRTKEGVSCNTLAELVGVCRFSIMRYESGETEPSLEDLKRIAVVLAIEPDKLYDDYYRFLDEPYPTKIKESRKEKGMLQREFGEAAGVTAGTVKRWESGRHTVTREMWAKLRAKKLL